MALVFTALAVCDALPAVEFTRGRNLQSGDAYLFDWPAADAACDGATDVPSHCNNRTHRHTPVVSPPPRRAVLMREMGQAPPPRAVPAAAPRAQTVRQRTSTCDVCVCCECVCRCVPRSPATSSSGMSANGSLLRSTSKSFILPRPSKPRCAMPPPR